jgi:RNA polymerase sigma-70 factor (ECF subfamily)
MNPQRLVSFGRQWVERVRAGDHAAFEAAFRAFYPELCAFAHRYLQSPALAEDAVHDVFMQLWRTHETLQVRDNVRAYLYAAVRHRALSLLRRQVLEQTWQARAGRDQAISPVYGHNDGPEQVEREQLIETIERVLDALPPRCRAAMVLRWQREMSYAEIAETMQISVKTVEAHLARATKSLRTHLPALFAFPDSAAD